MSLKRRNTIAWVLILLAAVLWALGQAVDQATVLSPTTMPNTTATTVAMQETTETGRWPTTAPTEDGGTEMTGSGTNATEGWNTGLVVSTGTSPDREAEKTEPNWGFLLRAGAIVAGFAAVFLLRQTAPLLGPDGAVFLLVFLFLDGEKSYSLASFLVASALEAVIVLTVCRELWSWVRSRLDLRWCLSARMAARAFKPQYTLLVQCGWICVCAVISVFTVCRYYYVIHPAVWFLPVVSGCLGIACLWIYGVDLTHFKAQLDNFQNGLPITVRDGTFAETEEQLLQVQARHEEAVRSAVTSERFKVELISNVSHDLRTPLTSILGYSELLQQESLSPEGQEQLRRLHQKAGYMNDLVESLFELTKVSSGVIEPKKEEIDLVRLLEQTLGLFDDQLTAADLAVRRHYAADAMPVVTDGARMHQVFANLLGNAIKYALPGTRIHLEVRETEEKCLVRMVNIASYEMDFQPEEIMQRFARGDKARSTKGSGLGLAIAQTYTESVGGTFRVAVDGDQFSAIVELPKTEREL